MFKKVISCALSPNTESDDVLVAVKMLCMPWKWKHGRERIAVKKYFMEEAVFFNSGRSAFLALLHAFGIGRGGEVIVQAFTCVAVPNSVLWSGATPIFADIDDSYNLDPKDVERKITQKTKVIVVQHTFGIPAQIDALAAIAKKHNLLLIEDFAHTMNIKMSGDAAFYSFGRDKVVSSVWGGAAVISSKYKVLSSKLKQYQEKLAMPGYFWIFQQLLHPIAFSIILLLYDVYIGKIFLVLLQKLHLLSVPVYPEERLGRKPNDFPAKYPNALAALLVNQLNKLDRYTRQRKEVSKVYGREFPYLRFPLRVENPTQEIANAKEHGILLGNWYHNVIDPESPYKPVDCPKADLAAKHIINLPTRISVKDAKHVWKNLS